MSKLYFIIGASGAGKTTLVNELEKSGLANFNICYFDSIGVPSEQEMIKEFGSPDEWQRAKTKEWVKKIKEEMLPSSNVILDAQTRPSFIEEACKENSVGDFKIILVDCNDEVRKQRLHQRGQPELANDNMMNWAKYLREKTKEVGGVVIDTSELTVEEGVRALSDELR